MVKKIVKFTDFNGVEREKELCFNFTRQELTMLQYSVEGGIVDYLTKIQESGDERQILMVFRKFILDAYGELSEDGVVFDKSEEIRRRFEHSAAFDEFFALIGSDEKYARTFIEGVFPAALMEEAARQGLLPN